MTIQPGRAGGAAAAVPRRLLAADESAGVAQRVTVFVPPEGKVVVRLVPADPAAMMAAFTPEDDRS